jgi:hydroxyacylglutathione hydrolase
VNITPIPCLTDNYAYLVTCDATKRTAIVDPSEAKPVLVAVKRAGVEPEAIWNTHHHWDHVGGNEELVAELSLAEVCGHASDRGRIAAQTRFLEEGDRFTLGELEVRILHIPGHTTGAIAYVVRDAARSETAVFTGDTLFIAGCGRLFEGTPAMMFASLGKLAALDDETRVYCGHEYTRSNLAFAEHIEPDNRDVGAWIQRTNAGSGPTVPSRIADEKRINPFVRARDAAELGARRAEKDSFTPRATKAKVT